MKTPNSRHDFLLQHYQRWLDDFTRLAVRHGLCHPNIQASHQLTIGSLRFTGTGQVTAVVPHALYRLFCGNQPPVITVTEDMSTRLDSDTTLLLHHPMLEGILLSECARLKQFPVQRALLVMLQRLTSREIRHKIVWLCWRDLMCGNDPCDWLERLVGQPDDALYHWLGDRQDSDPVLTLMMDEYLLFTGN
ncbi:hypothetical protein [Klebsiella pneumoniae]|uniref:hypothetical protein n=1 Tax=Klebsiella pneumoniae TaxID=573 RepID=UPI001FAAB591|nr:hypothetical protein [Klebsiella pneumoniae]HBU8416218.1 hypothetical protein [Klebsiella pneumoniae]